MLFIQFWSQITVEFLLLGLATGSLYAIYALGVVLTYRASGVLNFAIGSLGAIAAYFFYSLRDDHHVNWVLALALALALGALIGVAMHFLVMVLLRRVSVLAKLISTLALVTLSTGIIDLVWGDQGGRSPTSILPTNPVKLSSQIYIPEERLILIGIVLALTVILRFAYTRTMFGLATSAVAESRRVAAASGWSPNRIEVANFLITGVFSAGAAILLVPIIGLSVTGLTLVVLPALAAAMVGRFSSFVVTLIAALGIGVATTELSLFQPDITGFFGWSQEALTGLPDVVTLLVIIIAATLAGNTRLQRGEQNVRLPLPGDGHVPKGLLVVGVVATLAVVLTASPRYGTAFATTLGWAIVILSVVVVTGLCGQLSLCQFALGGFGAWVAARLIAAQGAPFELAILAAIAAAIPLGLLVALPALRTRGVNLAVATLGLALLIQELILDNGPLTGGYLGTQVPAPHFFGINIDPLRHANRYAAFVLLLLVLSGLAVANVRRGRAGRRLLAVRANERAAASLGVGVYTAKLYAFSLAAMVAAVGGVALGFQQPNVQFASFDVFGSINAVLFSVLGGIGWASGSVIGALQVPGSVPAMFINDQLHHSTHVTDWLLIIAGLLAFQILSKMPDGIAALQSQHWRAMKRSVKARLPAERLPRVRPPARKQTPPTPLRGRDPAELVVEGITVRFGGVVACDGIGFSVRPGEIVGLIGPNGAGKTTLLDVITGFTTQQAGTVLLDGKPVDRWSAEQRARAGMGRSWQAVELFDEMTVRENLLVAADRKDFRRYMLDIFLPGKPVPTQAMNEVVAEFELEEHLDQRPSDLSQGVARLVGIGRAIVTEPRILLLDEPAAGLDSTESRELGTAIRTVVARTGIGTLIVEHDVNLLLDICDRIVVLDFGRKIAEGTPAVIAHDPVVIAAYLGVSPDALEPGAASEGVGAG